MSSDSTRRILKELKELESEASLLYKMVPHEQDIFHWKGFLLPPEDCLYFGMIIPLKIEFDLSYPQKPPKLLFPPNLVFHPNFYPDGNVCVDILQDKWTPLYGIKSILLSILVLLKEPNTDSPANNIAAKMFNSNITEFKKIVKEKISKSWIHSDF